MTYLIARCGGECFIVGDSSNNSAGVISFDSCGWDGVQMSMSELAWRAKGILLRGERSYTVLDVYRELRATVHYAEMNDVALTSGQREAWTIDAGFEW